MSEYQEGSGEKARAMEAINQIIATPENHWGRIEPDGKVIAYEKEHPAMSGDSAEQFDEQSFEARYKYNFVVDAVQRIAEDMQLTEPEIADVGSGPGILTQRLAEQIKGAKVTGFDISADMVAKSQARTEKQGLNNPIKFIQMDALEVYRYFENSGTRPDIIVSRNMLHRLENLQEALMALARAAKDGGMVYVVAFLNPENFSAEALNNFLQGIKSRESRPVLQKAWTLAYLNAPTLDNYQKAVDAVSKEIKAEYASVDSDGNTYVVIQLKKS